MNFREYKEKRLKESEELALEYDALEVEYSIKSQVIQLRKEEDMSQKELAFLAHTTQAQISKLENGNSNPSIDFLKKIANALGKDIHIEFRDKKITNNLEEHVYSDFSKKKEVRI